MLSIKMCWIRSRFFFLLWFSLVYAQNSNTCYLAAHDSTKDTPSLAQSFKHTLPIALGIIGLYGVWHSRTAAHAFWYGCGVEYKGIYPYSSERWYISDKFGNRNFIPTGWVRKRIKSSILVATGVWALTGLALYTYKKIHTPKTK